MKIEIKNLIKIYDDKAVINDFSLEIPEKKLSCLMGPSGCGKTSILRCIAGFEKVSGGEIYIDGELVSSLSYHKPIQKRKLGFVFQDYALFPHLSLLENVLFGLQDVEEEFRESRALKYIELVGLAEHTHKYPEQLSGGQKQRLALARALAPEPKVLLMDEAFSNIDTHLRSQLAKDLVDIVKQLQLTCLMVTHSQEEAFEMADQIAVLQDGKLLQWDSSYEIYHQPSTPFVASFVGEGRFIKSKILETGCLSFGGIEICHQKQTQYKPGDEIFLLLRPDDVLHDDDSEMKAKVLHKSFRGAHLVYDLELNSGERLLSYVPSHHDHQIGEDIGIRFEVDHVVTFSDINF